MRLLLVRHTAVEVAPGLCYGRLDLGLSAQGEADAIGLAASLRETGIARVHTSPARRCRALADAVTDTPCVDPRLQELDFGIWEGRAWDAIDRVALDVWAADPAGFAPPGGERGGALIERVASFAGSLRAAGQDAIVIAHGGPLRLLPALLQRQPPDLLAPTPPCGTIVAIQIG